MMSLNDTGYLAERQRYIESVIHPDRLQEFHRLCDSVGRNMLCNPALHENDVVHRVAFYGFGDIAFRQCFYRMLQTCFFAEWYWSSETQEERWEMLVSFPFKMGLTSDVLDSICNMCRNDIGCDCFDRGISDSLVQFVLRIDKGKNKLGWLRHRVRSACDRHTKRMEENQCRQRVLEVTGADFTSGNMIHFYHEWRNALLDLQAHQNALCGLLARQEIARSCIQELVTIVDAYTNTMREMQRDTQEIIDRACTEDDAELEDNIFRMRFTIDQNSEFMQGVIERRQQNFNVPDFLLP